MENSMNEKIINEFRYAFDALGYFKYNNKFNKKLINQINSCIERIERLSEKDLPRGVSYGKPLSEIESYLSSVICSSADFDEIIFDDELLNLINLTTMGMTRLNHAYSITRFDTGGYTYMHMGGAPIHPKAAYMSANNQILSLTTKIVIPLTEQKIEDGCFAAIPGSHKSNFIRPYGDHPDENPYLHPIETNIGDVIIFTDSLAHGSLVKKSVKFRRTLYLCYSVGYMPDWTKFGLTLPEWYINQHTTQQQKYLKLKVD
jgi:hypothetical protein